jgi:TFIIF-interacting CTD phosphatase-like protein
MRPFVKDFLELMSNDFELVIFTSSMPSHAEGIVATLPNISHTLYRYHTTRLKGRFIKDLSRLGRPLTRTVIIDNEAENYLLHKENGIRIADWLGNDPKDQELNIIGLFLSTMVQQQSEDVRDYLEGYR